jgi:hypothetical protein
VEGYLLATKGVTTISFEEGASQFPKEEQPENLLTGLCSSRLTPLVLSTHKVCRKEE